MDTSRLTPGDRIQCNVRGQHFPAIFLKLDRYGWFEIEPLSKYVTWRRVRSRQIVERVERQERLEVSA